MIDKLSVWMSLRHQTFSNHYYYTLFPIVPKLGTGDLCANMQKTAKPIYEILT